MIVARRDNPDASTTLAVLCLHVSGELRSGYVLTGQSPERAARLCEEVAQESGTRFVAAPIGRLLPLVEHAAEKTLQNGRSVPAEADGAALLSRFVSDPLKLPEPTGRLTLTALRSLFSPTRVWRRLAIYPDRAGSRRAAQEHDPQTKDARRCSTSARPALWQQMATTLAKTDAPKKRLGSMLRHMAVYYTVSGELADSKLCLLAAHDVEKDFAHSRVVQLVAENTRRWLTDMADGAIRPSAPGSSPLVGADRPSWRQQLKSRFFAGIENRRRKTCLCSITPTKRCKPS